MVTQFTQFWLHWLGGHASTLSTRDVDALAAKSSVTVSVRVYSPAVMPIGMVRLAYRPVSNVLRVRFGADVVQSQRTTVPFSKSKEAVPSARRMGGGDGGGGNGGGGEGMGGMGGQGGYAGDGGGGRMGG